jgi:hypothetical protein
LLSTYGYFDFSIKI